MASPERLGSPVMDGRASAARGVRFDSGPANRFAYDTRTRLNFVSEVFNPDNVQDRLCGTTEACAGMAEAMSNGISGRASMASSRPRTADALSLLSRDTRYETLHPSSSITGPGHYDVESHDTSFLGTLAPGSTLCGSMPARDPSRQHAAFDNTQRGALFQMSNAHHLGSSVSSDLMGVRVEGAKDWSKDCNTRPDIADYRYSTRHSELHKDLPDSLMYNLSLDNTGRQRDIADRACSATCAGLPFTSVQPKHVCLPAVRVNDLRLSRPRLDDPQHAARGPGTYMPYTSIGGAKRKTYRLFVAPPEDASQHVLGSKHSTRAKTSARPQQLALHESLAFASTTRAHKFGAYSLNQDSTFTTKR
mmetsp:Transcript_33773/g.100567  ORF Transcript_33773/g.100567 Transcript_33773/m.100567 type:complete len:362 (-) Transcript_33773:1613-2698(-)